jgi:hypothetical protein
MAGKGLTFAAVRRIALALPGVDEGTAWGTAAFKVGRRWIACLPTHRSAEPGSLAVRVPLDQRAELVSEQPDIYYVPEHYSNYPTVLVRLSKVHPDALKSLLAEAVRSLGGQAPTSRPRRRSLSRS